MFIKDTNDPYFAFQVNVLKIALKFTVLFEKRNIGDLPILNQKPSVFMFRLFLVFILLILSSFWQPLSSQNVTAIIEQMEHIMRGESSYAEMTMTIESPRYTRDVSMKAWSVIHFFSIFSTTPYHCREIWKRSYKIWHKIWHKNSRRPRR